jgi:mono/diheme cytochrome c family protein
VSALALLFGSTLLAPAAVAGEDGAALFATYCASCHGAKGAGDGAAAAALDPKPANFSDPKFWATRKDADLKKAIKEGGAAVGKSPLMVAWGGSLSDAQIDAVVTYIKGFKAK